jgi:hypothetical protein
MGWQDDRALAGVNAENTGQTPCCAAAPQTMKMGPVPA